MAYECERVEMEAQPTLVVRRRAAVERLPEVLGPAWGAVMAGAARSGAVPVGAPFAAFHNRDMQDLDVETGFVFERAVAGEGEVEAGEIPAGPAVLAKDVGLTRAGLYEALSPEGNPSFATVARVAEAIGLGISMQPRR